MGHQNCFKLRSFYCFFFYKLFGDGIKQCSVLCNIFYGFGFRFAVLGLLEFIDWGGGDILYYASRYLEAALGNSRYAAVTWYGFTPSPICPTTC